MADEDNEDKYVVVTAADCTPTGDRQEVFAQLEQDLLSQIRVRLFLSFFHLVDCQYIKTSWLRPSSPLLHVTPKFFTEIFCYINVNYVTITSPKHNTRLTLCSIMTVLQKSSVEKI